MPWPWKNFEEFKSRVDPIEAIIPSFLISANNDTTATTWRAMLDDLDEFASATKQLCIHHQADPRVELTEAEVNSAMRSVISAVIHGERLLGYCQRLAESEAGGRFIGSKHFLREADRYIEERQLQWKLQEFYKACNEMLDEYWRQTEQDNRFLIDEVDLPEDLANDFLIGRKLMSVGFEEAAVIYCGRGLEGVVRRIAHDHNIKLQGNQTKPASEATFSDLLRRLGELRFKNDGTRLLDQVSVNLLEYGRSLRNSVAHPPKHPKTQKYREQAILMAHLATDLWKKCTDTNVQFV